MKHLRNFQMTYMINTKGQSLVELASFGAILLFVLGILIQYGMQYNHQQNLQMQAFRKAMKAAFYRHGPGSSASIQMLKDKPIPNPSDPWGVPERRPVSASASVTWDTNLQGVYLVDYDDDPNPADLPYNIIEINDTLRLPDVYLKDGGMDNIDLASCAFKTADFGETTCNGSIMIVVENTPAEREATHEEYREVVIDCGEIRAFEDDSGKQYAYAWIDSVKQKITSADVDNDNELESIIAVKGNQPCDGEGYCGKFPSFKYIDSQEGEINTEYALIQPWEKNKAGASLAAQQGLQADYKVARLDNNAFVKKETDNKITTTTRYRIFPLPAMQRTKHTIRLNKDEDADGQLDTQEHWTTFRSNSFTWRVNK